MEIISIVTFVESGFLKRESRKSVQDASRFYMTMVITYIVTNVDIENFLTKYTSHQYQTDIGGYFLPFIRIQRENYIYVSSC